MIPIELMEDSHVERRSSRISFFVLMEVDVVVTAAAITGAGEPARDNHLRQRRLEYR